MNQDFSDLLSTFTAHGVEFLVVGAHALAAHGHVRATKDLDVWVRASPGNAPRVMAALREFEAPTARVSEGDFASPGIVMQIGVPPVRIDILTQVSGVTFDEAWPDRVATTFGGVKVFVLSKHHLIQNKIAAGRLQDLADVERLKIGEE
jgi:hypothetical protein